MISVPSESDSEDQVRLYLSTVQLISNTIDQLIDFMFIVLNKRITLAEKAIQEELACCAAYNSFFLHQLITAVKEKNFCISESDCRLLAEANTDLRKDLSAFKKAANYNLNYLEQYFEHEFWIELANKSYSKTLEVLKDNIESKKC